MTSGTIFASRKLPIRDYLAAIAIFVNGAKGYAALQLSRDLDVQYKTAFVLAHKLREALGAAQEGQTLTGEVEVDGGYFGGYVKPSNYREHRVDRRLAMNRTGKRQVVVIMRERNGQSLPFIAKSEAEGAAVAARTVAPGSTIYADENSAWDVLHAKFLTKRINHSEAYSTEEACTNLAELYFPACGAPRSALTTTSQAPTSGPTPTKWLGGKTIGASRTALNTSWSPALP